MFQYFAIRRDVQVSEFVDQVGCCLTIGGSDRVETSSAFGGSVADASVALRDGDGAEIECPGGVPEVGVGGHSWVLISMEN